MGGSGAMASQDKLAAATCSLQFAR